MSFRRKDIKDNGWYIVDIRYFPEIRLLTGLYFTKKDAQNAIKKGLHGNTKRYDVIVGTKAKELGLTFWYYNPKQKFKQRIYKATKYNYNEIDTQKWEWYTSRAQFKKSQRTRERAQARRAILKAHRLEQKQKII